MGKFKGCAAARLLSGKPEAPDRLPVRDIGNGLLGENFYRCPTRHFKRAALVLITVYIEAPSVFARGTVFAHVSLPADLDRSAELQEGRACDNVVSAANVRASRTNARSTVRLSRDCIVARDIGLYVHVKLSDLLVNHWIGMSLLGGRSRMCERG